MAQEYISQVSEETEGRDTTKLSKEFSRTESRILSALSKLDEFLLNPQVRTCSVAVPGTSRNNDSENREPTGARSLGHRCPEAMSSSHDYGNLNCSELEETHHIVTEFQEATPFCSLATSSGKQKKPRSTSQPHENTPATIEAHQILLALQQMTTNSNSANFNNNSNRISKLPKSFTITMPTSDGKSEKFELFEDFFQTSWKIQSTHKRRQK